jgi:hypothetical protein
MSCLRAPISAIAEEAHVQRATIYYGALEVLDRGQPRLLARPALGILADGRKVVLGLWQGSTENAALCTALLQMRVATSRRCCSSALALNRFAAAESSGSPLERSENLLIQLCRL